MNTTESAHKYLKIGDLLRVFNRSEGKVFIGLVLETCEEWRYTKVYWNNNTVTTYLWGDEEVISQCKY